MLKNSGLKINKLDFKNGFELKIEENEIIVFVGPNNSGKSTCLKETCNLLNNVSATRDNKIIDTIEYEFTNKILEDFIDYLKQSSTRKFAENTNSYNYHINDFSIAETNISYYWGEAVKGNGLGSLHGLFVKMLHTDDRLKGADPPSNISLLTETAKHPIHHLQRNDTLENQFSNLFSVAFGTQLIVNRNAGNIVPLHVGTKPKITKGKDRLSYDYLTLLEKLPRLDLQGDGMKSFASVLLSAFISEHSVLLIDEPEAFLHPPQARILGKMLGEINKNHNRQLLISTHSEDILKGLLEVKDAKIKVVRITRDGDKNIIRVLDKASLDSLWADSILRYSNILSGLFHQGVIVCESDVDCKFYSVILDTVFGDKPIPDVLFTYSGGKYRAKTIARALKSIGVLVFVIVDFDIIRTKDTLRELVESLEGDWGKIQRDVDNVYNSINSKKPEAPTSEVKREITTILKNITEKAIPEHDLEKLRTVLKKAEPWSNAKMRGRSFIPPGEPTKSFDGVVNELQRVGIFILEMGELENFAQSVGGHGSKWLNHLLSTDIASNRELDGARKFVKSLINKLQKII